jgi:hypothetical protein
MSMLVLPSRKFATPVTILAVNPVADDGWKRGK